MCRVSYQATVNKLNRLRPYELNIEFPTKENAPYNLFLKDRNTYRDYIKLVFPEMAKTIGAKWTAETAANPNANSASINLNDVPIVDWPAASQEELMGSICYWANQKDPPTTLQICYAQEDLWILEGILRIIAATNRGSRANFQATIKEIEFIRFGARALNQAGDVGSLSGDGKSKMGGSISQGLGSNQGASDRDGGGMGNFGQSSNPMSKGDKGEENDPAAYRYVDDTFAPLDGAKLRSSMQSMLPADAPFVVAKRVPVRLRFKRMDQQKLSQFLAECGNAELVLEVRQVRVNTAAAAAPSGMGGTGAGGISQGKLGQMQGGSVSGPGGPANSVAVESSVDIPVEIYGIIYLYNPVNMEKLGLQNTDPANPAAAGVPGANDPLNSNPPATDLPGNANPAVDAGAGGAPDAAGAGNPAGAADAGNGATPPGGGPAPDPNRGAPLGEADDR